MRRVLIILITLGTATTACSSGGGRTSLSVTTSEPAAGKVTIAAPSSVKAGRVEVKLKNAGAAAHDLQLVRVEGSHSIDEVLKVVGTENGPIPTWLHAEGGVQSVAGGKSGTATMILPPGQYYMIDTNNDESDNKFSEQGGVHDLTVTGTDSGKSLPSAHLTITAKEYEFEIPAIKAGSSTVKFDNIGQQLHMVIAVPILAGNTIDDVKKALASNDRNTPPPFDFQHSTGTEVLDNGKALVTKMTFQKGSYAFICFLNDRAGGPPHFTLGMLQEVKVA